MKFKNRIVPSRWFRRLHQYRLLLLAFVLYPGVASAAEPDRAGRSTESSRVVSLTTDPTRPLLGMATLQGEVRLPKAHVFPRMPAYDVSVGGWVGAGLLRVADAGVGSGVRPVWSECRELFHCDRATLLWVGAQVLAYPVGGFDHGLQLGVEASFMTFWGTRSYGLSNDIGRSVAEAEGKPFTPTPDEAIRGSAFLPGVVIGYKLVTKPGFTLNPQLGLDLLVSADAPIVAPRLALNAGWSF